MNRFFILLKTNMKLLLRNKGFLFFLVAAPIVSMIILGLKMDATLYEDEEARTQIIEMENAEKKAVYYGASTAFIVKVYDGSKTELSEYTLKTLAETGILSVCRLDAAKMTEEEVLAQAKKDGYNDRAGALLYLKPDFDKGVLEGDYEKAFQIYDVSEDERQELFEEELSSILSDIHLVAGNMAADSGTVLETLQSVQDALPEKEVVNISGKEHIVLDAKQARQKNLMGYAFAIITLGFLFCGSCVAYTVIEEQEDKLYTRMMLSKLKRQEYLISKFAMVIVISAAQTLIIGIFMLFAGNIDVGLSKIGFLFIIFLLGLIFSTISLVIGILAGDVMSANYAVFSVWSISGLLAGVYFPLDSTSAGLKTLSGLMPQRWFLKATEMLFTGDTSAYTMIICITAAYLIIVISVGSVGLKIKRSDS